MPGPWCEDEVRQGQVGGGGKIIHRCVDIYVTQANGTSSVLAMRHALLSTGLEINFLVQPLQG